MTTKAPKRNIILYVGLLPSLVVNLLQEFKEEEKAMGREYRFAIIHDKKAKKITDADREKFDFFDISLYCDFNKEGSIEEALVPYKGQFKAVTCRGDSNVDRFTKIIPHVPYAKTPTVESLRWATNKLEMRKRFKKYNPKITPKFSIVKNADIETVEKLEKKIGYPMMIKPASLSMSRLVSINYHREDLEKNLKTIFKKIHKQYRESGSGGDPVVLAEEFIEGGMYSIDCYVNSKGRVYFCPMVYIKTGRSIGFDDFFGYRQMTPTRLKKESIKEAQKVAEDAIHALGLRSSSAHIELFRTEDGWKVIEIGPRVGGFRDQLYDWSFNINHTINDLLVRMGRKPVIPKKIKGYSVAMKIFAKKQGRITAVKGVKKVQKLASFKDITIGKKVGERATFAKNGGKSVCNIKMFNTKRSNLLADIRRVEQMIDIQVK